MIKLCQYPNIFLFSVSLNDSTSLPVGVGISKCVSLERPRVLKITLKMRVELDIYHFCATHASD